jgi:pSer/pThr/pTyr-binding forkhead associated (FHA) protein
MPKLILSMDGLVLKEIPLDRERLTIGRKPDNDIQIDNLAISGHHAVITTILNDAFLEDLNSTNGTYVNSQPIKKHVLQSNDVIELGKYRIRFLPDSTPQPGLSPSDFIETQALNPLAPPSAAASGNLPRSREQGQTQILPPDMRDATGTVSGTAVGGQLGVLQLLTGANAGRELELNKSLTTLGKPGKQVAVITRRPHGYFITHVEGASFPLLNGKQLDAQAHRLNPNDIIDIAGVKMEFFLR